MLVSVVIPAYNAERFIGDTVKSVLTQTHRDLELILIDDGSRDRTAEIVEGIGDDRVRVLRFENAGTTHSRNRGLREARGELIAFLDHDDRWYPNKLERQLPIFELEPDDVAVGTLMYYVGESGRRLGICGEDPRDAVSQERLRSASLVPCATSSIVWRTAVIHRAGEFDPTLPVMDELDMLSRVMPFGRFGFVPEPLGEFRLHPSSITARTYREQRLMVRFVHARRQARNAGRDLRREEFERTYRRDWNARRNDLVAHLYRKAGIYAANGRFPSAVGHTLLSLTVSPGYVVPRLRRQLLSRAGRATVIASGAPKPTDGR